MIIHQQISFDLIFVFALMHEISSTNIISSFLFEHMKPLANEDNFKLSLRENLLTDELCFIHTSFSSNQNTILYYHCYILVHMGLKQTNSLILRLKSRFNLKCNLIIQIDYNIARHICFDCTFYMIQLLHLKSFEFFVNILKLI